MSASLLQNQVVQHGGAFLLGLSLLVSAAAVSANSTSAPSVQVLAGDWNGDGNDTPGIFADGLFTLSSATPSGGTVRFRYGRAGDVAIAADWTGNGQDTIGIVRNGRHWHIRKTNSGGHAHHVFTYGSRLGRNQPVPGDWNGDGFDTPGVVRGNTWLLRNSLSGGPADVRFRFGRARGDTHLAGDWSGQGKDLPGVVRDGVWHLRFAQRGGPADRSFTYGRATDAPVVGDWNGRASDTPGALRAGTWFLRNRLAGGSADHVLEFGDGIRAPESPREELTEALEPSPALKAKPAPEPSKDDGTMVADPSAAEGQVEELQDSDQKKGGNPEADPATQLEVQSWQSVWGTGDFEAISGWYERNAGLVDPSVLAGVTTSQVVSTHDGQVIENLDIRYAGGDTKAIWVRHNDVVVSNNRVYAEGSRNGIWVDGGLSGVVIEHNELDGSSPNYGTGRDDGNWGNIGIVTRGPVEAIRNNRVFGTRQAILLNPFTTVEYNYIYDLHVNASGVSTSGIRSLSRSTNYNGGTWVRRNMIESGTSGGITAYAQGRPVKDCLWEENLVVGVGRGFGILGGHSGSHRDQNRDIVIQDNRFHGTFGFPNVRGAGTNASVNLSLPENTFHQNRWLDSNTDLPARCGTRQDACE